MSDISDKYAFDAEANSIGKLLDARRILAGWPDVSAAMRKAIAREAWENPANIHLHGHETKKSAKTDVLDYTFPAGALVYLPARVPGGVKVATYLLRKSNKTLDDVAQSLRKILAKSVDQAHIPIYGAVLWTVPANALLRAKNPLHGPNAGLFPIKDHSYFKVYYYTTPKPIVTAAAIPQKPNVVTSFPDWWWPLKTHLGDVWGMAGQLDSAVDEALDHRAAAKGSEAATRMLGQYLQVLEKHVGGSSFFDRRALRLNLQKLPEKTKALADALQLEAADLSKTPNANVIQERAAALRRKLADPAFRDAARPVFGPESPRFAMEALGQVMQAAFDSLVRSPLSNETVEEVERFLAANRPPTDPDMPVMERVLAFTKVASESAGAGAGMMIGNTPGPLGLVVAVTKAVLIFRLNVQATKGTLLVSGRELAERIAKIAKFNSGDTAKFIKALESQDYTNLKPFQRALATVDEAQKVHQTGRGFTGAISIINAFALFFSIRTLAEEGFSGKDNLTIVNDVAGLFGTTVGGAGAMLQFAASFKAPHSVPVLRALLSETGLGWFGHVTGGLAIITGILQISQGIHEHDNSKVIGGAGSVLLGAGYFADLIFAKVGPKIAARMAIVLGMEAAEAGVALALASLGTALSILGLLAMLYILVSSRKEIMAALEAWTTAGAEKFFSACLFAIEKMPSYPLFVAKTRKALDDLKREVEISSFITVPRTPVIEADLRAIGLGDDEFEIIFQDDGQHIIEAYAQRPGIAY